MEQETNKFTRAWIWLWYNDVIRISTFVGVPVVPTFMLSYIVTGNYQVSKTIAIIVYVALIILMMIFNDYSNLRRIGMDEYRNKLKCEE